MLRGEMSLCYCVLGLLVLSSCAAAGSRAQQGAAPLGQHDYAVSGPGLSNTAAEGATIQTSWRVRGDRLVETELHAAVSKLLGIPRVNPPGAEAVPVVKSLFSRKKANLLVLVTGVTASELDVSHSSLSSRVPLVSASASPRRASDVVVSMLTGIDPEVGRARPSVMDECSWSFERSKIISVSADPKLAAAFSTRVDGAESIQFSLDRASDVMVAAGREPISLATAKSQLRADFQATLRDGHEHAALYLELATMLRCSRDEDSACGDDDDACMYSYVLTGLSLVGARYGRDSAEYAAALSLTKRAVTSLLDSVGLDRVSGVSVGELICLESTMPNWAGLSFASKSLSSDDEGDEQPFFWDTDFDASVVSWHMVLWVSVILTLVAIFACRCMRSIEEECSHSLLYRMTSISDLARGECART